MDVRSLSSADRSRPLPDNAWEGSMHPQTIHLDSIWLVPPALAVSFMVWVLWSWWKEEHRMNRRNRH
jgi:hypothetical protein